MHPRIRVATGLALHASTLQAAELVASARSDILIGSDDDNQNDPENQPQGVAANQNLNNADTLIGGGGDNVLIGMLGNDVLLGGPGNDVLIGGIERGSQPNSDIQLGESDAARTRLRRRHARRRAGPQCRGRAHHPLNRLAGRLWGGRKREGW
jgi:Ca2+-binding RTX toxin-like protein